MYYIRISHYIRFLLRQFFTMSFPPSRKFSRRYGRVLFLRLYKPRNKCAGTRLGLGSRRWFSTLFMRLGQSVKIYEITFPVGRYLNGAKFWLKSLVLVSQTASGARSPPRSCRWLAKRSWRRARGLRSLADRDRDGEIDRQTGVCVGGIGGLLREEERKRARKARDTEGGSRSQILGSRALPSKRVWHGG